MKKQYTLFQVICAMIGAVIYTISILDMLGVTNIYKQITEFVSKKTKRYFGNEVGVMNRNHRSYDQANIWDCIQHDDYIQSMLRQNSWIGEIDHPSAKVKGEELTISRISNPDMERSSHYIWHHVHRKVKRRKVYRRINLCITILMYLTASTICLRS